MPNLNLIRQNISLENCSFYIIEENKIAIAEISLIPKDLAITYIKDTKVKKNEKEKIESIINQSAGVFFFNRLNVPKSMQNKGYGKQLMKALIEHMNNTNSFLLNTANAYGDMSQKDLIEFYEKSEMKIISKDGLLIYHKNIEKTPTNKLNESQKKKIKP